MTHSFPTRRSSDLGRNPARAVRPDRGRERARRRLPDRIFLDGLCRLLARRICQRAADVRIERGAVLGRLPAAAQPAVPLHREIGRAHVCTPVTNAHLVCRLLLENKKTTTY